MPKTSDHDDDIDDDEDVDQDPSAAMKNMRRELRSLAKENKELAAVRRENAMLKAGVDPTSKLGQMFAKSYDGDLSDIEAIKAEAVEIGLLKAAASDDITPPTDGADITSPASDPGTNDRRNLSNGALPEDGKDHSDPRQSALERAEKQMKGGVSYEKATGSFIADLAERAINGDTRVLVQQ